jgi:hypothetical protein
MRALWSRQSGSEHIKSHFAPPVCQPPKLVNRRNLDSAACAGKGLTFGNPVDASGTAVESLLCTNTAVKWKLINSSNEPYGVVRSTPQQARDRPARTLKLFC